MRDTLINCLTVVEEESERLWQGKGADIEKIGNALHGAVNVILDVANSLPEEDRTTTMSYIENGLSDYKMACDKRDDFLLADCLYYQWREIITIYIEALEG